MKNYKNYIAKLKRFTYLATCLIHHLSPSLSQKIHFLSYGDPLTKALENPSTEIRHFLSWFVNVNKWESRFLRLNTAKNTDFIKKCLKYT